jgi:hypothetical protein
LITNRICAKHVWWYVVINDFLKITKATPKFVSLEKKPEKNSIELSNVHYRKNSCVSAGVAVCKFLWATICSFSFEISIDKTFCHSILIVKRPLQIFLAVIFFTHSICKLEFYQPTKKTLLKDAFANHWNCPGTFLKKSTRIKIALKALNKIYKLLALTHYVIYEKIEKLKTLKWFVLGSFWVTLKKNMDSNQQKKNQNTLVIIIFF